MKNGYLFSFSVEIARKVIPDIKIILMTAFEVNGAEFDKVFPSTKIENIIRKPFNPSN